jgi:glycosyltransferase involved in cell wall biosynthesis
LTVTSRPMSDENLNMKTFAIFAGDLTGQRTTPGGVVHVIEVCRNLLRQGHEVTLFVPGFGRYPGQVPFRIIYVPIIRTRFLASVSFALSLFLCLTIYLLKERCDLIYENDVMYSLGGVFCSKLFRKMHFMNVHGFSPEEMEMGGHSRLRISVVEFFQKTNYRLTDGLFCVTPYIVEKVHLHYRIPKHKMVFVFNGVDSERCRPMDREEALSKVGLSPARHYVGFIGYLYPWSGLESLVEAASWVVQQNQKVDFVIVGHGIWGSELERIAARFGVRDHFIFAGYQAWDRIPLYSNAFEVGVTPYVGEKGVGRYRSSMKTLEYLSAGTPVIITRAEGVSDIVENAGCGIVIPPDEPRALADAILMLIGDPEKRRDMGMRGRKLVLSCYTWQHTVQRMLDFIGKRAQHPSR